jgi:hypothetical protein
VSAAGVQGSAASVRTFTFECASVVAGSYLAAYHVFCCVLAIDGWLRDSVVRAPGRTCAASLLALDFAVRQATPAGAAREHTVAGLTE